jgi:hypothetical protein
MKFSKFFRSIKARIRGYKAKRKLEKSKYGTWRQYKHNRDPDVYRYADYVEHFYKGYPYVYAIKDYKHYAFQKLADYGPGGQWFGYDEMTQWCEEKIRWNYRRDIHRVLETQYNMTQFNDIGGSDYIYFAFKNEKDFSHFLLRWS